MYESTLMLVYFCVKSNASSLELKTKLRKRTKSTFLVVQGTYLLKNYFSNEFIEKIFKNL